jgi:hypothetical protein
MGHTLAKRVVTDDLAGGGRVAQDFREFRTIFVRPPSDQSTQLENVALADHDLPVKVQDEDVTDLTLDDLHGGSSPERVRTAEGRAGTLPRSQSDCQRSAAPSAGALRRATFNAVMDIRPRPSGSPRAGRPWATL